MSTPRSLILGFTGSKEDFAALLPLLADRGWLTATYDQRGQYETPPAIPEAYSLEALAADAASVVSAVSPDAVERHLLGHSFGGLVAQTALLADPPAWRSLTLLCSGPGRVGTDHDDRLRSLRSVLETSALEVAHDAMRENIRRRCKPLPPPELEAFLRTRFLANSRQGLQAMIGLLLSAPDRIDELARLGVPCAVVRGADDDAWAHDVQAQMAARLGTTARVIRRAAHSPAAENPSETARVLCEFWDAL